MSELKKFALMFFFIVIPEAILNYVYKDLTGQFYGIGFITGFFLLEFFDYKERKEMRKLAIKLRVIDELVESGDGKYETNV